MEDKEEWHDDSLQEDILEDVEKEEKATDEKEEKVIEKPEVQEEDFEGVDKVEDIPEGEDSKYGI